ncbi:MAG: class I SAM-dependent methyltransferase [Phycisphaerales bacterium]|jgi:2-polyprenyl-3-methyl-5-hydroxy-6-metoxy-1,4-benzoquinol methylase
MSDPSIDEQIVLPPGDCLGKVVDRQLRICPQHVRFLRRRFTEVGSDEAQMLERLATWILQMAGERLDSYCGDYDWLVATVLEEELHFRRNDRYRLETLEQAIEQVYSRPDVMTRYMNGLLMTQLWWSNHTQALLSYERDFLGGASGRCLEIGPGHGLLMHLAARSGFETVEALDISEASIEMTRSHLRRMGADPSAYDFHLGDLFDASSMARFTGRFDGVVFSEVLEHLDRPEEAMRTLYSITKPGGRVFIHVPINSPAPDHLFLLRSPEEARQFVGGFGFEVQTARAFPATNLTLERAIRLNATISCVFVLGKPGAGAIPRQTRDL